ncbi:MAG: dTMP kinase [Candidatus Levybacteria bacterium]|nr:dTMP kinase [Candidatus Levybacteria bacterium]
MRYHVEFDIDLKRNPYKGIYIALEGIDGSGKTTQAQRLKEYFESKGRKVIATREPRKEGFIGDIVQAVLQGKTKIPSTALQYLFSTERVIHHEELVLPALKAGKIVITDRCFWSAIVYGILDRMKSKNDYKMDDVLLVSQSILSMYNQFIVPDFTFYLQISLKTAMSRISNKDDIKEIYEDKEKLKKVIIGYDWLAKKFDNEITMINGEQDVKNVTKEMIKKISFKIKNL